MRRQSASPLNAAWYPPVAGPGDEPYLYLPDSIASIKGFWTGTSPHVTAHIASERQGGEFSIHRPQGKASGVMRLRESSQANDLLAVGPGSA